MIRKEKSIEEKKKKKIMWSKLPTQKTIWNSYKYYMKFNHTVMVTPITIMM